MHRGVLGFLLLTPLLMAPRKGLAEGPRDSTAGDHDDRDVFHPTDRRTACDRHPQPLTAAASEAPTKPP